MSVLNQKIKPLSKSELSSFKKFMYNRVSEILNPETVFVKDRFQILTHVIYEEINISRNDEPLTLQSLERLNAITEQIFCEFDNKISIEENVKKFYGSK